MMHYIKTLKYTIICGLLIISSFFLESNIARILQILAIIIGGFQQTLEGIQDTIENKRINVELLMILSAIGATLIGDALEGATLIFIFSLSGELETLTSDRSHREIRELMTNQPHTARKIGEDGSTTEVPLEDINVGDLVSVLKGENVSIDGVIIEGQTEIDESMITGESVWAKKKEGDHVYAGTLNISGPLTVKSTQISSDTLLQKIVKLVEESVKQQSKTSRTIETIETYYSTAIILVVIAVYFVLKFVLNWDNELAMYRSIILLVVASPCALIASVTPATLAAVANAARHGILIKGGSYLEGLVETRAVAFDKTGTLTVGKPQVTDILVIENEAIVLQIVKSIESKSTHPLATAIVSYLEDVTIIQDLEGVQDINGVGLAAMIDGVQYHVGKYQQNAANKDILKFFEEKKHEGKTMVAIYENHNCVGMIALKDTIRPEAIELIKQIKSLGVTPVMLTGDHENSAQAIASQVGIERFVANCMPEDKVSILESLKSEYGDVLMVGDGINDAPSLATATTGISIGSGTDIAIESADIVLMKADLNNITYAMNLSKKLKMIIRQNITFALSVIAVLITLNIIGIINLPLGVVGHEGSTILVILNSLRMLKSIKVTH